MEKQIFTLKDQYKAKLGIKLSRNEKRKGEKELEYFQKEIEPFIFEFEQQIFDETSPFSYKKIYNSFLESMIATCEQLNRFKFKVIQVDTYFFQETYKPLELN